MPDMRDAVNACFDVAHKINVEIARLNEAMVMTCEATEADKPACPLPLIVELDADINTLAQYLEKTRNRLIHGVDKLLGEIPRIN